MYTYLHYLIYATQPTSCLVSQILFLSLVYTLCFVPLFRFFVSNCHLFSVIYKFHKYSYSYYFNEQSFAGDPHSQKAICFLFAAFSTDNYEQKALTHG